MFWLSGSSFYEWFSHNLFVLALVIGSVWAMVYFVIKSRKKGRYH
ncbi:EYxxD motif small membrane protein [Brevibacillus dissolubilis]|nr:EYxxD motif small membrane protein [Brevibacillus dissolubilis]